MLLVFLSLSFISAFMFTQISSPLGLGGVVIIFSFFVSLSMSVICATPWFSLLLFMLFLSGMMIIFIYVCSLASNESHFYMFSLVYLMALLGVSMLFSGEIDTLVMVSSGLCFEAENSSLMYKVYSFNVYLFSVMLIIYLLITLIAVVKISVVSESPMRAKK
uniref:NADH dehydrogenase subunit 6 n=1 Tax=Hyalella latimana TaxID=2759779 RepID=A0A7T8V7K4_9CRUS|nr:NADH dehydrogenase subunit 6 [Hyalella latimana]